jgi:hypothetical protein
MNCARDKSKFGVTDWKTVDVTKLKSIAGYIVFLLPGAVKDIPKAVLCDSTVLALLKKVLQYGPVSVLLNGSYLMCGY